MTWNGTETAEPLLIFHDELLVLNGTGFEDIGGPYLNGTLVCMCQSPLGVAWHFADGNRVPDSPASVFQQIRVMLNSSLAVLSRGAASYDISDQSNGLWMCRHNESADTEMIVGLYQRNYRYT